MYTKSGKVDFIYLDDSTYENALFTYAWQFLTTENSSYFKFKPTPHFYSVTSECFSFV